MRIAAALALFLCATTSAVAQGVMVGAQVVQADHYLAGDPLAGVSVRVTTPLRVAGGAALYLRFGGSAARSDRFGSPCGGFVPPGTCSPQPVEDRTRVTSADIGLSSAFMSRRRFELGMDLETGVARWTATSRGRSTGETGDAAEFHMGAGIGLWATVRPASRVPLAIEIGAGAGASNKPPGYEVIDGYTPFAELITHVRYHVGVAWRR